MVVLDVANMVIANSTVVLDPCFITSYKNYQPVFIVNFQFLKTKIPTKELSIFWHDFKVPNKMGILVFIRLL